MHGKLNIKYNGETAIFIEGEDIFVGESPHFLQ